jgi:uncharacterized protein
MSSTNQRALAPDLARGAMLLLIAVANAAGVVFGGELGVEPHPHGPERVANFLLLDTVHARAYPMFAVLFGYGLVQLAARQPRSLLLRRYGWLVVFGFAHAALLYSGDFLGAYGLVGIVATVTLLRTGRRADRAGLALWVAFVPYTLLYAVLALTAGGGPVVPFAGTPVDSLREGDYWRSVADRLAEWPAHTAYVLGFIVIVWLGMIAARRRILEEPGRHVRLLRRVAVGGLGLAFLGGLPLALVGAGWLHVDRPTLDALTRLHGVSGQFGGPGFVAVFGLLAARGWGPRGLVALGRRSLSGYLTQSVVWLLVLTPVGLHLADRTGSPLFTGLAVAVATWALTVLAAAALGDRRGPAERLLRRLASPGPRRPAAPTPR